MSHISATWTKVASAECLQRSSHVVSVVNGKAYVFGGELQPRQPRDNKMFEVDVGSLGNTHVKEALHASAPPCARVGSASATLEGKMFFFSGRGGEAMTPIDEKGSLWVFDPESSTWAQISLVVPPDATEVCPQARSYHCATSNNSDRIFIHGGCPASGRLSDLWSWHAPSRAWMQHKDAPAPARGGPSITWKDGLLYRMNGFDGKSEQGGHLDIFNLADDTWKSVEFQADGVSGPAPRSVSALLPVTIAGRPSLITFFGEGDPSTAGHAGAGKMFDDIWAYSIDDASWSKVEAGGAESPAPRGWFDADVVNESSIFLSGGLGESNERLNDAWVLSF